jgi:hypothetical protein
MAWSALANWYEDGDAAAAFAFGKITDMSKAVGTSWLRIAVTPASANLLESSTSLPHLVSATGPRWVWLRLRSSPTTCLGSTENSLSGAASNFSRRISSKLASP